MRYSLIHPKAYTHNNVHCFLSVLELVRRYPHVDVTGNDEADALVLAAIAARLDGHPVDEIPAAHVATLTKAVQR